MKIAQIAPPWITVPPAGYGGTEWVVQQLCDGLSERGHDVTLFASGDSQTAARLRAVFPQQMPDSIGITAFDARHVTFALDEIVADDTFDLVHDHSGFLVVAFSKHLPLPPVLHTIHCAFDRIAYPFYERFADAVAYNAISTYHQSQAPAGMNWAGVVHNAIDLTQWPYAAHKDDYLLAFGRICADKGFHLAIEVARRTGHKLIMAGVVQEQNRAYFEERIKPELDDQVTYEGEVSDARKHELFAHARAFLFPIVWPEPFGLVMIEAMATGTPVIALRQGSVPEVIADGRTGFIVETVDEMVAAVDHIATIDSSACRRWVEDKFTVSRMIDGYEALYDKVRQG
ncbi:MAG: glycosyltransferase family 4 protein [Thermoleophilia bacterium]